MNKIFKSEIICLWFPYLPVEIPFRNNPNFKKTPFAVTSKKDNIQNLYSINPVAESLGLEIGDNINNAYTLCKNLVLEKYNIEKESCFIKTQATWCNQFTPRVSIETKNMLILDLKGCTHLFGNKLRIIQTITNHFKKINISVLSGLGENTTIAKASIHFNKNTQIIRNSITTVDYYNNSQDTYNAISTNSKSIPPQNNDLLKTIPIESLDLDITEKEEIKYLGVETIHDLQSIPYKALLTRFGPKIIKNLKKSIGVEPELRSYFKSKSVFSRSINLPEPISLIPDIIRLYEKLTNALCTHLKNNNKGTRALNLNIHRVDNTKQLIQIKTAEVTSNSKIFIRLFKLKLNQVEAGFGIEFIRVSASDTEDLPLFQDKLQIGNIKEDKPLRITLQKEEYKDLILKLSNKIGFDSLIHLHPNQSHIPENNTQKVSAAYCSPTFSWPPATHQRPLLIFRPEAIKIIEYKKTPKLFIWRKKTYNVIVSFGPERIAAEWWLDSPQWRTGLRDYWKIEAECGIKLWLFEAKGAELKGGWFIHGSFI